MNDLYNEKLIRERGFRCKDCSKLMHEHSFSGEWGGAEQKFIFDMPCSENFCVSKMHWRFSTTYPNLIRVDRKWYYFSSRAAILSLIAKADTHLVVATSHALIDPKPILINTLGDMYNFAVTHSILNKLQKIVDAETFKSMQSKSIARSLKKLSA